MLFSLRNKIFIVDKVNYIRESYRSQRPKESEQVRKFVSCEEGKTVLFVALVVLVLLVN
jgi:hypothetical protein